MTYLLGLDLGTSSLKTILYEVETGQTVVSPAREYPIHHPQPGYAEQNPDGWWNAAVEAVRAVLHISGIDTAAVRAISLDGHMHGGILLGADLRPVRPAIIWADTRGKPQVDELRECLSLADIAQHAPGLPAAGFFGPTLKWLAQHEPDTLRRTHVIVMPKDYVRLQMTGTAATDPTDAAATWLFDITSGDWSDWLLEQCQAERRYLPPVLPSAAIAGELLPSAAAALGLPAGIPVITGCADLPAQGLGHRLYAPGRAILAIGTGGQVFSLLNQPLTDSQLRYYVFDYPIPGYWYVQTAILSAGLSLRWLRDTLGLTNRPDAYDYLSQLAAEVPPGADGLVFLPYLAGERTPHMDAAASGLFLGLRLHHTAGHLARAVMEGVTLAMDECLSLVLAASGDPDLAVTISGGAATSPVWRQIQADIYQRPLTLAAGENHGAVGSALLAGVGAGIYTSFEDACSHLPAATTQIDPNPANTEIYAARRDLYRSLYPRLQDTMHRLNAS
ncbi:MAG TPA: xylulokinase [Phototrophicaceae bacterium]|nr:xylulokinase [Phototrophicaceae bacterium]